MMKDLYKEIVLDHFRRPRNKGELEGADVEQRVFNPLCGDEVTVYANLRDGGLAEVAFTGRGCAISQASASMLAESLEGKDLGEAEAEIAAFMEMMRGTEENEELGELAALKAIIQAPNRIRCATLAWEAMRRGLED
jgi:nitrogen fixation NifU-like protein